MAVRPPAYVRSIARDVLAVSVGFGLGITYSLVGGFVADDVDLPADSQRTERSSTVSAATWTDGRTVAIHHRGRRPEVHRTGRRSGRFHCRRQWRRVRAEPYRDPDDRPGRRHGGPGSDLAERSRNPRCEGECIADDPVCADALLRGPHGSRAGRHRSAAA